MDELDAFLELHAHLLVKPKKGPREDGPKFKCSCGLESTDIGTVKAHAWQGHVFHKFGQKPWSMS